MKYLKSFLEKNTIKGGKSDDLSVEDIAKKFNVSVSKIKQQLQLGIKVESEHTDDKEKQREIAMDHLVEIPDYYDRLKKMEDQGEKAFESSGVIYDEDEQRIIDSIEGIFIDLEDQGFIVDTTLGWEKLLVIIHNDEPEWDSENTVFTYSQIEDKVLMLIDYMKRKWGDKLLIKYIYKKLEKVNMKNPFNRFPIDASKWGPSFSDNNSKTPPKSDDRINSFNISIKKDNSTGLLNKLLGK